LIYSIVVIFVPLVLESRVAPILLTKTRGFAIY